LAGIFLGGGILYLIAIFYHLLAKKEGMGGGDIKLLAMLGGFIGIKGILFTVFAGSLLGTLGGILMIIIGEKGRYYAIPFGPFLSAASVLYLFFGKYVIEWYLQSLL
jgi:leader peptidase (prepilin peptidase)/N-methyltransferase